MPIKNRAKRFRHACRLIVATTIFASVISRLEWLWSRITSDGGLGDLRQQVKRALDLTFEGWPRYGMDYLDGKPTDTNAIAALVAQNKTSLDQVRRGTRCPACLMPPVVSIDADLSCVSRWQNLGRLMAAKARHDRLAGHYAEATDTCLELLRFSDLVQSNAECELIYLISISILSRGTSQIQDLARDASVPPADLQRLATALGNVGPPVPGQIRALKAEYWMDDQVINDFRNGKYGLNDFLVVDADTSHRKPFRPLTRWLMPRYLLQPNRTKRVFAELYRGFIADAPRCYSAMVRSVPAEIRELESEDRLRFVRPNLIGRVLYGVLALTGNASLEKKCRAECTLAATRLIVACHAYRRQNARFPETLQSLVPAYIPAIPLDPFDGQPFRYSPAKCCVYSVGKDLKDSGGSSKPLPQASTYYPTPPWDTEDAVFALQAEAASTQAVDTASAPPAR